MLLIYYSAELYAKIKTAGYSRDWVSDWGKDKRVHRDAYLLKTIFSGYTLRQLCMTLSLIDRAVKYSAALMDTTAVLDLNRTLYTEKSSLT